MVTPYYLDLKNIHEFRYHCSRKSLAAFESILSQGNFPSRFTLLTLLVKETAHTPYYLTWKLGELAGNVFPLFLAKSAEITSLPIKSFTQLTELICVQLMIPYICTAIRISATILGLLLPSLAVNGWKLAQEGECLSYLWWSDVFKKLRCEHHEKKDFEEICPYDALFYLGERQTQLCLEKEHPYYIEIEKQIVAEFSNLLKIIALDDQDCFYKLLGYDSSTGAIVGITKYYTCYYLDHDVKQTLIQLRSHLEQNAKEDNAPEEFIDEILEGLSINQIHRLFDHIYFNLRNAFLEDNDLKLDQTWVKKVFTKLKDLFSQRFHFGRAHFYQSVNRFHFSSTD